MLIIEDLKTGEQKERAAQLLKQLLQLIDQRDALEREKLSAQKRYVYCFPNTSVHMQVCVRASLVFVWCMVY